LQQKNMPTAFRLADERFEITAIPGIVAQALQTEIAAIVATPLVTKHVSLALAQTTIAVRTITGSSPGFAVVEAKLAEMVMALVDGATQIEFGINSNALFNNDWQYLAGELNHLMKVAGSRQVPLWVNINSQYQDEKTLAACCDLYGAAGVSAICLNDNILNATHLLQKISFVRHRLADAVGICLTQAVKSNTFTSDLLAAGATEITLATA
jgi:deoxyribose-phosphate aldolase